MERRTVITGAVFAISLAGCLGNTENSDSEESPNNSTQSSTDGDVSDKSRDENGESGNGDDTIKCSFYVEIIEDTPKDAPVESAKDHQLMEIAVLEEIFDIATDPDSDFEKSKRRGGEFENFIVKPDSSEETKEAMGALDTLPEYQSDTYLSGVYIEHEGTTVAIVEGCVPE